MGSEESKNSHRKGEKFSQLFYNNFELQEHKNDDIFGEIELFRNKNTKRVEVVVKHISALDEHDLDKLISTMRQRILKPIPNLLSIFHLEVVSNDNLFCGSSKFANIYFEYLDQTLQQEIKRRRKHKSNYFSEEQLWKILISLINAIKHLHEQQIFHGEIRFENVLIDQDFHMKLVQKSLVTSTNWQVELNKETVKMVKGSGVLFSPCILKCLQHHRTQISAYDPFKGDIFAIGMILLECCSFKKAQQFYDYALFEVKMRDIQYTIYELRKKYSWELINILQKMLDEEDEERIDAESVYEKIRKIPNETIRELNMTLNQSFLNQSIRSYM